MVIQITSLLTFLHTDHLQKECPSQAVAPKAQTVTPNDVITRIVVNMGAGVGTGRLIFYGFIFDLNQVVKVGGW